MKELKTAVGRWHHELFTERPLTARITLEMILTHRPVLDLSKSLFSSFSDTKRPVRISIVDHYRNPVLRNVTLWHEFLHFYAWHTDPNWKVRFAPIPRSSVVVTRSDPGPEYEQVVEHHSILTAQRRPLTFDQVRRACRNPEVACQMFALLP